MGRFFILIEGNDPRAHGEPDRSRLAVRQMRPGELLFPPLDLVEKRDCILDIDILLLILLLLLLLLVLSST